MNIVYALSGEGRGHGSLARAILPTLQQAGHKLKVVTYGQSVPQMTDFDVIRIRGIRHQYDREGRLSLFKTITRNLGVLAYYASNWRELRRRLGEFAPDLFIVNFEPFTPLLAASLRVPVVSFDNQHAHVHLKLPVPAGFRFSSWITRAATSLVAPHARHYVIMAFAGGPSRRRNVSVVPPVVKPEIRQLPPQPGNHVLVYLKQPNPRLLECLRQLDESFLIYGYDAAATHHNLTFKVSGDDMPRELAGCKAVLGTAGFSLLSEAVWLKKPFFGVPLKNEFEQTANAMFVRQENFGDYAEEPTRGQLSRFFHRLEEHRRSLAAYRFDADAAGRELLKVIAAMPSPAERGFLVGDRARLMNEAT